jgi:hypothetical protein
MKGRVMDRINKIYMIFWKEIFSPNLVKKSAFPSQCFQRLFLQLMEPLFHDLIGQM